MSELSVKFDITDVFFGTYCVMYYVIRMSFFDVNN